MRYFIIDSHRNLSKKRRTQLGDFLKVVKQLKDDQVDFQVDFGVWFEKEYGVKWFEAVATDKEKVVGYMRCYRNPKVMEEWFVGDINVLPDYRQRGIATKLYEKVIEEVKEYEAAQRIVATINSDNVKSIGLHTKLGFKDTGSIREFADFYFEENETTYELIVHTRFPLLNNNERILEKLFPLWCEYKGDANKEELKKLLEQVVEFGEYDMETIWCGHKLVGFAYWNESVEEEYINDNIEEC